jgi:GABA(A) receptor-associated protein
MYESVFKNKYTFSERICLAISIKEKCPDKLPIICEKQQVSEKQDSDMKIKFLVPKDFTFGNFIYTVKNHLLLSENTSIFMFINNSIIPRSNQSIRELYNEYRDDDMFLYIKYCNENTFG